MVEGDLFRISDSENPTSLVTNFKKLKVYVEKGIPAGWRITKTVSKFSSHDDDEDTDDGNGRSLEESLYFTSFLMKLKDKSCYLLSFHIDFPSLITGLIMLLTGTLTKDQNKYINTEYLSYLVQTHNDLKEYGERQETDVCEDGEHRVMKVQKSNKTQLN